MNLVANRLQRVGLAEPLASALLDGLTPEIVEAGKDLRLRDHGEGDHCFILEGVACQSKSTASGERSIVTLLLAGDIDQGSSRYWSAGEAVETLTRCKVVRLSAVRMARFAADHPAVIEALAELRLQEQATLREWVANMGGRGAQQRLAHVLCEFVTRLRVVGVSTADCRVVPLSQKILAEVCGLSIVHVSRILSDLRGRGILASKHGRIEIEDLPRLIMLADFKLEYLGLSSESRQTPSRLDRSAEHQQLTGVLLSDSNGFASLFETFGSQGSLR